MSSTIKNMANWQSGKNTVQERLKYLLQTGLNSDVQFLVGVGDGTEEKQLFNAHKFVLSMGSSIFAAQFQFDGTSASSQPQDAPINVVDIPASAFNAMLNFLYTNNVSLINKENFVGVYTAAKKYLIDALAKKCIELAEMKTIPMLTNGFVKDEPFANNSPFFFNFSANQSNRQCGVRTMLDVNNVVGMLEIAKLHDEDILIRHCWKFIEKNIHNFCKVFNNLTLGRELMGELLARDKLKCTNELLLFTFLNKWAEKQCENMGINEPTVEQKRTEIGTLLYAIRFPLIPPLDFINEIVPKGILNNAELSSMLLHYAEGADERQKANYPLPFSDQPRANPPRAPNKLVDKFEAESGK